MKKRHSLLEM